VGKSGRSFYLFFMWHDSELRAHSVWQSLDIIYQSFHGKWHSSILCLTGLAPESKIRLYLPEIGIHHFKVGIKESLPLIGLLQKIKILN
jgi:hypothetical protein